MGFSNWEFTDYLVMLCVFGLGIVVGRITMAFQVAYMKDRANQIRRAKEAAEKTAKKKTKKKAKKTKK